MQEASFTGFFKMIIYMIGLYYLVKFLARIFLPIIVQKAVTKAQESFQNQQGQNPFQQNTTPDFQTPKNETQNPKSTKQVGDYIDYEEVE